MSGTVEAIYIAPEEGAPIAALTNVKAVAGRGLEGDRYFHQTDREPDQEITLIEAEGLEAARAEDGLDLPPGAHRRNIVTRGVDLEGMVGARLRVGEAEVEVLAPNPPCRYLQDLTGRPVLRGLRRRGGVRGRIVREGLIRVGDPVEGLGAQG